MTSSMKQKISQLAVLGGQASCRVKVPNWPVSGPEEEQALLRVLHSGQWCRIKAQEVANFEQRFAEYQGCRFGISATNGTVTLRIALIAAGIAAGDEVIVPPYTFIATASSVVEANATPVFVDIDPDTYCIDPTAVEAAITLRTRAIIPVHFGGRAAEMDAIMDIASRHNLVVIEDAAQAHGAEYKGRRLGSIGHMGSFSFQGSKNLCGGEGGMITTNDEQLAETCRSIENCGRTKDGPWYAHARVAGNYRMTEFQGALLNCQLDRLEEQANKREETGRYLASLLEELPGIKTQARDETITRHAYHLFMIRYDESIYGVPRAIFLKALQAEGVIASGGYGSPLPHQPMFTEKAFGPYTACLRTRPDLDYSKVSCPVAEHVSYHEGLWLPPQCLLAEKQDMDQIAQAFEKVYKCRDELKLLVDSKEECSRR